MSSSPDGLGGDPARLGRIEQVIDQLIGRADAAARDDDLIRAHPDLMPELEERLGQFHAIQAAQVESARRAGADRGGPAQPDEELAVLQRALTGYEVLERLRHGGQGAVYRARQHATKRTVAIKVLLDGPLASERQRARFEREAEVTSRLRHPNIVTLFEHGVVRNRPDLVMEFVDGLPITDYVLLHDRPPRAVVALCIPVCRAVHHAHQNGVIHRDLNPANILVDEQGVPRVLDFGLAKDLWATDIGAIHSHTGQIVGTLPYLSPEQAGGFDARVDVRSDVYALGVVLYELLSGELPYARGQEWAQLREAIVAHDPRPLSRVLQEGGERAAGVNRDLDTIVRKSLAKEKQERYQSAEALAEDLEHYLAGDAVRARTGSGLYVLRKTLRRHRRVAVAAAACLLTFVVASAVVLRALALARSERDRARKATHVAYGLFDRVLDLDESIRPLAGGVAVRDDLLAGLSSTLPWLGELVQQDAAFSDLELRLAERQGDIAALQGRAADAARYYAAVLQERARGLAAEPNDVSIVSAAARAYRKLASVAEAPNPLFESGIQIAHAAWQRDPDNQDLRRSLLELHVAFGDRLLSARAFAPALEQFEAALACRTPAQPEPESDLPDVARALSGRALALAALGHGGEALPSVEESVRLRERICAARGSDSGARYQLLLATLHLANLLGDADRPTECKEQLQRAADLGDLLHALDPGAVAWARSAYGAHDRLVGLCLHTRDADCARSHAESAARIASAVARARPHDIETSVTCAFAAVLRGRVELARDAPAEALVAFEEAVRGHEQVRAAAPENRQYAKDLADAQVWCGIAARKSGDSAAAIAHYQRALQLRATLLQLEPDGPDAALDLIETKTNLAAAHLALTNTADDAVAAALLKEAESRLEELRSAGKLIGLEQCYQLRRSAITANLRIVETRQPP